MELYDTNSTRLGSIIRKRTSSGVACIIMLVTMALMQTLLPLPVAPAMSRCGILVRSAATTSPATAFPEGKGRAWSGRVGVGRQSFL